ncbi:MAG: glycosyltransferase family 2 protein [Anaerolineaceae bacterium]|nr:glycosyltransferase family 2 protein [Anaerolineaceae bacterium]MDD9956938.1 glycosyltransferase family 2 protein [Anaerolineaceae bacterium]MDE0329147.1 glycosyltransferase family 2 protein [Anaerolineaceae bacterium]
MADLGIVILNWNTRDLLRRCLQTVLASEGVERFRVVVVDNASSDDSVAMLRQEFPQVGVIANPVNSGYPAGNNLGLRQLGYEGQGRVREDAPRHAMLLNPDTEVPPDALARLVDYMDARPEIGIAGPRLMLPDGSLDLACRRSFPSPQVSLYRFTGLARLFPRHRQFGRYNMTFADPGQELEVDAVVGACMIVRREAIAQAGLLDEDFFMYGEDLDWAWRIKAAGWKVYYQPQVVVQHVKRAASRQSRRAGHEFQRAMLIFYRKHYRRSTPLWLHSLVMTGLLLKGGRAMLAEIRQPTV